jgi:hypothetical protein
MAKGPISDESTQREVTWSFKVDRLEEQVDIFGDNEHMSTGYSMEIVIQHTSTMRVQLGGEEIE